jgi:hypothetical protein
MWVRRSSWLHWLLTGYLWMIAWFPLGNWNRQSDETLLPALVHGKGLHLDDIFALAFVTLPAVLFWIAYKYRSVWFGIGALAFDAFWGFMQVQSWWIPYIFGTNVPWQLRYAKGPTTKILPSFGDHVAPDAMHFVIHVLLAAAFVTGIMGIQELWLARKSLPHQFASTGPR